MDGVLVVDKPRGLTSHDVVAVARRVLRETRVGHTGTLDPMATGVLPLAVGRATRLVRFLTASDKDYDATIRFGLATDSYDVTGTPVAESPARPTLEAVEAAIDALRGEYLQLPPPYSAKKVAGRRAYELARANQSIELTPVPVRVPSARLTRFTGDDADVSLTCSAGFYVRSFAHALGERVGTGACLAALRRTRSGGFSLADAVAWDRLTAPGTHAADLPVVPLAHLLPDLPAVTLTAQGRTWVSHGRAVPPADYDVRPGPALPGSEGWVRLFDAAGTLAALGQPDGVTGAIRPSVVLL
mgnify:CR=1 FL=1